MALLTKSGRIALAASLKNQALHLAWGSGSPSWELNSSLSFNDNAFTLPNAPVKDVILTDENSQDVTSSYDIDLMTGDVSRRDASLPSQKLNVTYTSATPAEDIQSDALIHEIGRRVIDEVSFCEPDPEGFTVTPTGRFSKTDTPTRINFISIAHSNLRMLPIKQYGSLEFSLGPKQRAHALQASDTSCQQTWKTRGYFWSLKTQCRSSGQPQPVKLFPLSLLYKERP